LRFGEPPGSIDFGLPPVEQGVYRGTIRVKVKQIIDIASEGAWRCI
jgi:hypothetical protein